MKPNHHQATSQMSAGKVFLGVLLAAAYGFTASILLTPMSGKRTRHRLKHFLDKNSGPFPKLRLLEIKKQEI